jgi:hypothetical protein
MAVQDDAESEPSGGLLDGEGKSVLRCGVSELIDLCVGKVTAQQVARDLFVLEIKPRHLSADIAHRFPVFLDHAVEIGFVDHLHLHFP